MIAKARSGGLLGLDGYIVEVEADLSPGLPAFDIVGLPDAAVKEAKERVRSAVKNCGLEFPTKRITMNLAPAHLRKEGPAYDLPITMALLAAAGQVSAAAIEGYFFIGELSLDGRLRPVSGILPMVIAAVRNGICDVILPKENSMEAAVVAGANVYSAEDLGEIMRHFRGDRVIPRRQVDVSRIFEEGSDYLVDFADVKGQEDVKRAIEIAVAGGHNILLMGSPGAGKSMLAQRIPTILPAMSFDEALEVTKIHSIAGILPPGQALVTTRPFRNPHHTISAIGLAGGGASPRPGELSLSHNGVLFMDELPEFHRDVLEIMRQPLEDGKVTISRVAGTFTYPCSTLFAASMNPCRCGYYGDPDHECQCTPPQVAKYRGRISGPLLDRIDIYVEVPNVKYKDLESDAPVETSATVRARVNSARGRQRERYKGLGVFSNAQLMSSQIRKYCMPDAEGKALLKTAFESMGLSARAHDRILKVARTIADLEEREAVGAGDVAEAIQYRQWSSV